MWLSANPLVATPMAESTVDAVALSSPMPAVTSLAADLDLSGESDTSLAVQTASSRAEELLDPFALDEYLQFSTGEAESSQRDRLTDLNGDGVVDLLDLALWLRSYR